MHFQGEKQFAPAPIGAIAMKVGEFQYFDNSFFEESGRCNILKTNYLR
jgi:hypothetical protein